MSMGLPAPTGAALRADRKTVGQLLNAARKDTDAASVFWLGTCPADSDDCIIVIKGRDHSAYVIELLQRKKLLTPGKDVEGGAACSSDGTHPAKREAVINAALNWWSDRQIGDWDEASLARAIVIMEGDWSGCEGCDSSCDEPCAPATVSEQLAAIDERIAQLVHDGRLLAYEGYKPPEGFKPITLAPKRNLAEDLSKRLDRIQSERDRLLDALTACLQIFGQGYDASVDASGVSGWGPGEVDAIQMARAAVANAKGGAV